MSQPPEFPPVMYNDGGGESEPKNNPSINIEAERSLLGSLMIDPDAIRRVIDLIKPTHFFRENHQLIYKAMVRLGKRQEPIDFTTLVSELEKSNHLERVEVFYLTDLVASVPTALYVLHYAKLVYAAHQRREAIAVAGKIAQAAYEIADDDELHNFIEETFYKLISGRMTHSELERIGVIINRLMPILEERMEREIKMKGLPTGFTMIDRILGGLQKGDLIVIAARPGMGKSAFVLSMILNMIRQLDARVALFSLEMSNEQTAERVLSSEAGVDGTRLRTGDFTEDEFVGIMGAANALYNRNLYVSDFGASALSDIRSAARKLAAEDGLDLIVVDYMQLMQLSEGKGNRQEAIAELSRGLKLLAGELNVPVIALSQLSRAVEARADKRPMLSDLRESGAIEQDASVVMFLYREDYYIEDTDRQNICDVLIAKHRHGSTGTVSLFFRKELTQFRDLEIQRTDIEY